MLNLDRHQLSALAEVLRNGSFDGAAAMLGVTPSAISQRIRALEDTLGCTLVQRGQPCRGTVEGLRLFRHAQELELQEQALASDLDLSLTGQTQRPLRIAANADSLATWMTQALAEAQPPLGPPLLVDLTLDDQDHSADWLRRGDVVAAVTSSATPVRGCDVQPLGALRYRATASPEFVAHYFPNGLTSDAMAVAPSLVFNRKDRLQHSWLDHCGLPSKDLTMHLLPSTTAFVEAALLGIGWGMNPEVLVVEHIRSGRLIDLGPTRPLDTPLYWQWARVAEAALAPLTQAVRKTAQNVLIHPTHPT